MLPSEMNDEAINRQTSSMCYPAQIALGYLDNLIDKKPDYYFMPHVEEMYVPNGNTRREFSATCIFIQGESFYMQNIFQDKVGKDKFISPTINFSGGWHKGEHAFIKVAQQLGFTKEKAQAAFQKALAMQQTFEDECRSIGKAALEKLHSDPDNWAVVLFGRPYNAFTLEANKGIPKKLASRGPMVIPFDMLAYADEPLGKDYAEYMHWELGQKVLRAAQIVKRDKQLFGTYITNFLCAIDSLLVTYFRKIMQTKPSLTLELDGHTADAGINTRIEAFYDIIRNYQQVQKHIRDAGQTGAYRPAEVIMENSGTYFIDSDGKRFSLKDPRVKMILPAMNPLGNRGVAAILQKLGVNAYALPIADKETLSLGRGVTTCKECLPMIMCVGAMLQYLKYRKDPDEKLVVFQPRAAGYCRLGQYHAFMNLLIKERKIRDVALISLANEERYAGLGPMFALEAWKAIVVADVFDDIQGSLWALAKDVDSAMAVFNQEFDKVIEALSGRSRKSLYTQLKESALLLKTIPLRQAYADTPQITIMGEIYVRKDPISNLNIAKRVAEHGFIPRVAPISEWIYYLNYKTKTGLQDPEYSTFWGWLEFYLSEFTQRHYEKKIKNIMSVSGLCDKELIDIDSMIEFSKHIISPQLSGEPGMIAGVTMRDAMSRFSGVINIGPFGCMPVRFTEAVINPMLDAKHKLEAYTKARQEIDFLQFGENERIPFLTVEADGNPYPQLLEARFESFCLQSARISEKLNQKPVAKMQMPSPQHKHKTVVTSNVN
jgi:predicted nucleotide-binding protein (sugar kinase/HSP70/actin superfamily)